MSGLQHKDTNTSDFNFQDFINPWILKPAKEESSRKGEGTGMHAGGIRGVGGGGLTSGA